MTDPLLKVEFLQKYYGNKGNVTKVINEISLAIDPGEFVGIMGPSGSGKTTLLNCIATLEQATTGSIKIKNQDITHFKISELETFRRKELGFIFQDFNLLDKLTVFENIALSLTIMQHPSYEIEMLVKTVAKRLEIEHLLDRFPYHLSGGQKQRVAVARAIVKKPSLILADEPTGALDSKSSSLLMNLLQQLNEEANTTILMVTHDAFTASYANRILFIKDGEIFNEIYRGVNTRKVFFEQIIETMVLLGGDVDYVF